MKIRVILIAAVLVGPVWAGETKTKPENTDLEIYLPRETRIDTERLKLGDIAVVRSVDHRLSEKAAAVRMGRSPWPGERLVLSQATIRGRLVSVGIPSASVWLSGSPKITVRRREISVSAQRLREAAIEFLAENRPDLNGQVVPLSTIKVLYVAGTEPVELEGELKRLSYPRMVAVKMTARRGDKRLGSSTVLFRRVKDAQPIAAPSPTTPAKPKPPSPAPPPTSTATTKVITRGAAGPAGAASAASRRSIAAGYLPTKTLRRAKPVTPMLIRSGQQVRMRIRGRGFEINALGQAMQDGRLGQIIRMRNVDSQRIVNATVASGGIVEPIMRGENDEK